MDVNLIIKISTGSVASLCPRRSWNPKHSDVQSATLLVKKWSYQISEQLTRECAYSKTRQTLLPSKLIAGVRVLPPSYKILLPAVLTNDFAATPNVFRCLDTTFAVTNYERDCALRYSITCIQTSAARHNHHSFPCSKDRCRPFLGRTQS